MGNCNNNNGRNPMQKRFSETDSNFRLLKSPMQVRSKAMSVLAPLVGQQPILNPTGSLSSSTRPGTNPSGATASSSGISSVSSSSSSSSAASSTSSSPSNRSAFFNQISIDQSRYQYVAIFDYDARTREDLTIRKNDLLEIFNRQNVAWWKARNERGQEGWIPSNYVAKRDSLESEPFVEISIDIFVLLTFVFKHILDGISNRFDASTQKNNSCLILTIMDHFWFVERKTNTFENLLLIFSFDSVLDSCQ